MTKKLLGDEWHEQCPSCGALDLFVDKMCECGYEK